MIAAQLSPPVAYRLGAWLASEPGRTWDYSQRTRTAYLWGSALTYEMELVAEAAGADLDAATVAALDRANGAAP